MLSRTLVCQGVKGLQGASLESSRSTEMSFQVQMSWRHESMTRWAFTLIIRRSIGAVKYTGNIQMNRLQHFAAHFDCGMALKGLGWPITQISPYIQVLCHTVSPLNISSSISLHVSLVCKMVICDYMLMLLKLIAIDKAI